MPLNLQGFISPIASRIGELIPDEEDKERIRQQFQEKAISIANFAKEKIAPKSEPLVSPISDEETQQLRVQKGVKEGKFISPLAEESNWEQIARTNSEIKKWYSKIPESKTMDIVDFMKKQKEQGIYDYQKAIESENVPVSVPDDAIPHWSDIGKLKNHPTFVEPEPSDNEKRSYYKEISEVWGELTDKAYKMLEYENAKLGAGPEMDVPNRIDPETGQWDDNAPIDQKYDPFTDSQIDSIDRGLFRINNINFYTFLADKRPGYRDAMYKAGIIDGPHKEWEGLTPEKVQEYWDRMLDPVMNTKMAKVIFDKQGWDAWLALANVPDEVRDFIYGTKSV